VDALGLGWISRRCTWSSYQDAFVAALRDAAAQRVTHLVCGDIVYPEHRQWVERVCAEAGLHPVEPLWGEPTIDLGREFLNRGGVARIVAVDAQKLSPEWLYRQLDEEALSELARLGVDPCGENGEYHTVVTACPAFSRVLTLAPGAQVLESGYWAIDVRLASP
jgi:diphthine-ammonia ligase